MAVSLDTLVEATRLRSGLRNNRLFSDVQIAELLSQGYSSLRDKMIVGSFAHWFAETYDFTLAGGEGGNTLDLSLVPRLEMVQGLDLLNGNAPPFTVPMLDSFASRNQYNNLWPLGAGWSFNGYLGRRYWLNGDELIVYPPQNSAGNYRLIYTPQPDTFLAEQTATYTIDTAAVRFIGRDITWTQGDHVDATSRTWTFAEGDFIRAGTLAGNLLNVNTSNQSGLFTVEAVVSATQVITFETPTTETFIDTDTFAIDDVIAFNFPGAAFTDDMVDGEIVIDFDTSAPPDNAGYNGTFTIFSVTSATLLAIVLNNPAAPAVTNPSGGTVTINWQPPNTIAELPQALTPWSEYLVLYASISIRTSRQQQIAELEQQFQQITARIVALTKQRSEGIRQAPITRGWGGNTGGGWMR